MSPASEKAPVSVLVPVRNEERNLPRCLAALTWADEVCVVDSASTDRTAAIAGSFGARVEQFVYSGGYPKKKNWALENVALRNEWVLIVDADEVITPELAAEIADVLREPSCDGYFVNRRFLFMGHWIRHCGYYPSWNMRLFRRALGRYETITAGPASTGDNEVHEHVVLQGRTGYLRHDMLHYAYPDLATWVEKHNRYSDWESYAGDILLRGRPEERWIGPAQRLKRSLRRVYARLPLRFVFRFFYAYVIRLGFLDGRPGLIFCLLLSFYDFLGWAKAIERRLASDAA